MTRKYEVCCLLKADVTPKTAEEIQNKITAEVKAHKGKVTGSDQWPSRPLGYTVQKDKKGIYTFTQFESEAVTLDQLKTYLTHHESVLRHDLVRVADDYDYSALKIKMTSQSTEV
jgi:ribosomal protein S6